MRGNNESWKAAKPKSCHGHPANSCCALCNKYSLFYHTGYYSTTADNVPMYFATVLRTLFSVCVPLFMILSGFLLCNKTLKKGYYSGIRKTIIVYILVAIACIIYKSCNGSYTLTPLTFLRVFWFFGCKLFLVHRNVHRSVFNCTVS